jgi:hypothetical protein
MLLSELAQKLKLTTLKEVCPITLHKNLLGEYDNKIAFVKLKRITKPEAFKIYLSTQDWFLEPLCLYIGENIVLIATPFVEINNKFEDKQLIVNLLTKMLKNNIVYLDWADKNNFAIIDGELKVIDLDQHYLLLNNNKEQIK